MGEKSPFLLLAGRVFMDVFLSVIMIGFLLIVAYQWILEKLQD